MGAETISNKRHTDTGTKNRTTKKKKKKKESDQVLEAEKIGNKRHTDTKSLKMNDED